MNLPFVIFFPILLSNILWFNLQFKMWNETTRWAHLDMFSFQTTWISNECISMRLTSPWNQLNHWESIPSIPNNPTSFESIKRNDEWSLLFFLKIHYDNRFIMLIVRRCAIAPRREWKVDDSIAWLGCRPISGASVNQYWGSDSERGRLLVSL